MSTVLISSLLFSWYLAKVIMFQKPLKNYMSSTIKLFHTIKNRFMISNIAGHVEQWKLLYVAGGNVNWYNFSGNLFWQHLLKFIYAYSMTQQFYSKNISIYTYMYQKTCIKMFITASLIIVLNQEQPKCLLAWTNKCGISLQ